MYSYLMIYESDAVLCALHKEKLTFLIVVSYWLVLQKKQTGTRTRKINREMEGNKIFLHRGVLVNWLQTISSFLVLQCDVTFSTQIIFLKYYSYCNLSIF